jgi:hypothetical protein
MNIFVLSTDAKKAARLMCNRHVVKMITESAQMMAVACKEVGVAEEDMPLTQKGTPWKGTAHVHHPCTRWVVSNYNNFLWLFTHAKELNRQFRYRYDKAGVDHASMRAIQTMREAIFSKVSDAWDKGLPNAGPMSIEEPKTPFPRAFGDFEVHEDVPTVQAYRAYYNQKVFADGKPMRWTSPSSTPHWYTGKGVDSILRAYFASKYFSVDLGGDEQ